MAWRCQECDYLGEEIVETDEHDEGCPECGGYCIEVDKMTDAQEEALENFFKDNEKYFIMPGGNEKVEFLRDKFRWDDCRAANEVANTFSDVHVYTVIDCEDEEAWLVEGVRYVNRIAYYMTTRKIEIPKEGLRYW